MKKHRVLHEREAKRVFWHQTNLTLNTFLEKGKSFKKRFMISIKKSKNTEVQIQFISHRLFVNYLPSYLQSSLHQS